MMTAIRPDLRQFGNVTGELRFDEPMSEHTSWRVGGTADVYFVPTDIDDLGRFLSALEDDMPVTITGLGSNLLVRDGGLRGAVVCTHKGLDALGAVDANRVRAEAGVPGAKLARFTLKQGLRGAEFFAGIPGTIGGALAMNAGAFGGETWNVVQSVETVDRNGRLRERAPEDFEIGYRSVTKPDDEYFVAATFVLQPGDASEGRAAIKELLAKRGTSQPIGSANAGSVFTNPDNDYAARLIEAEGLKGHRQGGAQISEVHANFIVNTGDATAKDIEELIEFARRRVLDGSGVELHSEVRVVGEVLQ